jgi:copper chaperone NosL
MKQFNILQLFASLLLLMLFVFPLWRITLSAPQYPEGISMYIWINKITGDTEYTLQNINILNHYVGMKFIEPDEFPEFKYFPLVVIAMSAIGAAFSFFKNRKLVWIWLGLLVVLGSLAIYDFYLWEYDYGHNLSPSAPIKVPGMAYQPPLLGTKMLLNFKADSYPYWGGLFVGISVVLSFISSIRKKKK